MRLKVPPVNEGNESLVKFELFDRFNEAAIPDSAEYRIDDALTDEQIRDWTSISPITSNVLEIPIDAAENALGGDGTEDGMREVTIRAYYSGAATFKESALYVVVAARYA